MNETKELEEILKLVGPKNIWRPVVIREKQMLADGIGEACDGLPVNNGNFKFDSKTVVDLGCNFGYYSFFARNAGASQVLGIDNDKRIIRGCDIIKALNNVDRVTFQTLDITKANGIGKFEIGMMINLIGKDMIRTGKAKDLLNSLERLSQKEMLLTLRPRYHINKKLQGDFKGLREKYPAEYIRDAYFHMVDYVCDRFKTDWEIRRVSSQNARESGAKQTLRFLKKR
jgi:hypothetical protein